MLFISAHFAFAAISNTRTKIHKRKKLEKTVLSVKHHKKRAASRNIDTEKKQVV